MVAPLRLTTGDLWDDTAMRPIGGPDPAPADVTPSLRRSRDYVARFVQRVPPLRAIRMKCGACLGGDADQMPRGEVASAIDECASTSCPLWPFRYGTDPWRPEPSEAQRAAGRGAIAKARARLEMGQTASAENARDGSTGTTGHPAPAALAGAAAPRAAASRWRRHGFPPAIQLKLLELAAARHIALLPAEFASPRMIECKERPGNTFADGARNA